MNSNHLSSDDPKLTAYALGELDAKEEAQIAEAIRGDVIAQGAVEEIRALARQMEEALENEPVLPTVSSALPVWSAGQPAPSKVVRFPVYLISGLAAACVMVVVSSRQPASSPSTADPARGTQAQSIPSAKSDAPASAALPGPVLERPALPLADARHRALSSKISDVKPAPLRDDGLQRWRSITDNRGTPSDPRVSNAAGQVVTPAESQAYQVADYKNLEKKDTVEVANLSEPKTDVADSATPSYEVVSMSALEAARFETDPEDEAYNTLLFAENQLRHREFLTLKISYKLPVADLTPRIELPRVDPGASLALIAQDFKLALAAPELGKKLKEAPHKGSSYDQILTWAEENQDATDVSSESRHESIDAVKKVKSATVE